MRSVWDLAKVYPDMVIPRCPFDGSVLTVEIVATVGPYDAPEPVYGSECEICSHQQEWS